MIKVLIVEDDPMVALINRRYLEEIGNIEVFGPVMKEDEIISVVNSKHIDLILLDVFMPKKSGLDILKSLRSKRILVDVIMITAANSVDELRKAFAYGAVDYLVKPFEFSRFEEAINKYKSKISTLAGQKNLEQSDIDSIYSKGISIQDGLPKGLNKRTLEKILEFLESNSDRVWTLREISTEIGISNVTIKKYMDHLESINKISVEMTSGNVGRPELKYSLL